MSTLIHAGFGGGLYGYFMMRQPAPIVAELDLSMSPLMATPANKGGGYGAKPAETWTLPKKGKQAPAPEQLPVAPITKEEVVKEEATVPCVEPCTEKGPGNGWGGGTGEGEGQYVPESETSRKPRWIGNFITSDDYPLLARQHGNDGRVVLSVLIDAEGHVRDARLLQGSYEVLNEVALRKVKAARFSPAYSKDGRPVSCKVTIPIRFELR